MKRFCSVLSVLMVFVLLFNFASCGKTPEEEYTTIVFSEKFLNVAEFSAQRWVALLEAQGEKEGEAQYGRLCVSDDGKTVILEITEAQKAYWFSVVEKNLQGFQTDIKEINNSYDLTYTSDYKELTLRYNLGLSATGAVFYVIYAETYCAFGQMLLGESDWLVSFEIYNSDTGKIVTTGDSNTGLKYETEDWIKSY